MAYRKERDRVGWSWRGGGGGLSNSSTGLRQPSLEEGAARKRCSECVCVLWGGGGGGIVAGQSPVLRSVEAETVSRPPPA